MQGSSKASLWVGIADLSNLASQLGAMEPFHTAIRGQLGPALDLSPETLQAR